MAFLPTDIEISVLITCDFSYQKTRTVLPQESTPILSNLLRRASLPHHLVNNLLRKWLVKHTSSKFENHAWVILQSNDFLISAVQGEGANQQPL